MVAMPGVFVLEGFDGGTQALVEAMDVRTGERGAGHRCGAGLAAWRRAAGRQRDAGGRGRARWRRRGARWPPTTPRARSCPATARRPCRSRRFDVVLANPPFHQGRGVDYDVALQFIRDARAVLAPGGRLYLGLTPSCPTSASRRRRSAW
jgi:16S rRNA (guanine1207-N2)-methyltransferase